MQLNIITLPLMVWGEDRIVAPRGPRRARRYYGTFSSKIDRAGRQAVGTELDTHENTITTHLHSYRGQFSAKIP